MRVLLDSWKYQPWRLVAILLTLAFLGLVILANSVAVLIFKDYNICLLTIVLLIVLGGGVLYAGVFSTPVKICEEGILMQFPFSLKSSLIRYEEIKEIRFFFLPGDGSIAGCTVTYNSGMPLDSPEMFGAGSLGNFAKDAEPILLKKGFVLKNPQKKRIPNKFEFVFEKR